MKLEWDENKRLTNLQKHKIDFIGSEEIFDGYGYTVTFEDDSVNYKEQRFVTFGKFQDRVVAVVHTERNGNIRIISIRKATKHEERYYYATITN
jgi:uncharacterized DUF497 family protein